MGKRMLIRASPVVEFHEQLNKFATESNEEKDAVHALGSN